MKKRSTNINQHYVPQFYLRNFTNGNGKIYVYDINRNNQYITTPAKECYSKYFYDIETEYLSMFCDSDNISAEVVDNYIRILNENVSAVMLNFLHKMDACNKTDNVNFHFPHEEKNKLFDFILIQIIRTPVYRNKLNYLTLPFSIKTGLSYEIEEEKIQSLIHNFLTLGLLVKIYNIDIELNSLFFQIFGHLINELLNIKKQLESSGIFFLINRSEKDFVCSSNPINLNWKTNPFNNFKALITPMIEGIPMFDIGYDIEFSTVYLPISSKLAVFIFDKEDNLPIIPMNHKIGIIEDWNSDLLLNLNYSTMIKSDCKIFSAVDDFETMKEMYDKRINPRLAFRFN